MTVRFRDYLHTMLQARDWSIRDYAKKLGHASPSTAAKVLTGERPVPLDDLTGWIDALEPLTTNERDRLWTLAIHDYAPAPLRDLWRETHEHRRRIDGLRALIFGSDGAPEVDLQDRSTGAEELRQRLAALRRANRGLRERLRAHGEEP